MTDSSTLTDSATSGEAPVTMLATPMRLDYQYTAGLSQSRFLHGIAQGKFIGQRCPACHQVYVPPAGRVPPTVWPPPIRWSSPTRGR